MKSIVTGFSLTHGCENFQFSKELVRVYYDYHKNLGN